MSITNISHDDYITSSVSEDRNITVHIVRGVNELVNKFYITCSKGYFTDLFSNYLNH